MALTFSINAGYVFSEVAEETITGAKLNRLLGEGFVTSTSGTLESANIADDDVTTAKLADGAVTLAKVADNTMDGTIVKNIGDQDVIGGIPLVYYVDAADATATYDITVTHKIKVIDVEILKKGGNGGTTDSVTIGEGANAITTMSLAIVDDLISRAVDMDDANTTIAASGTLRVDVTKGTDPEADIFVHCIRVA